MFLLVAPAETQERELPQTAATGLKETGRGLQTSQSQVSGWELKVSAMWKSVQGAEEWKGVLKLSEN